WLKAQVEIGEDPVALGCRQRVVFINILQGSIGTYAAGRIGGVVGAGEGGGDVARGQMVDSAIGGGVGWKRQVLKEFLIQTYALLHHQRRMENRADAVDGWKRCGSKLIDWRHIGIEVRKIDDVLLLLNSVLPPGIHHQVDGKAVVENSDAS